MKLSTCCFAYTFRKLLVAMLHTSFMSGKQNQDLWQNKQPCLKSNCSLYNCSWDVKGDAVPVLEKMGGQSGDRIDCQKVYLTFSASFLLKSIG